MNRLIIVTGSSRGIGAAIAKKFNTRFNNGCLFILIARDLNKLDEVKTSLIENSQNQVLPLSLDLSSSRQINYYLESIKNLLGNERLSKFEELYVIYNHGTLEYGSISEVAQSSSLNTKFETNLFSVWGLLAAIKELIPTKLISKQYHVNISSGYSEEPTAKWSVHCCGK
jgi:short-subunit dehydrogenase